jgi:hypothetical protein
MRASNSVASSLEKALSRLSIGTPCSTGENCSARAAPTRTDGEFSRISSGKRASMSRLRRLRASYSASVIVGASCW